MTIPQKSLLDVTFSELSSLLGSPTRARATLRWLWSTHPVPDEFPLKIPDVSAQTWNAVRQACSLKIPRIEERRASTDGTIKYLLNSDGAYIESVLIFGKERTTLCISSQSGCSRRCSFCATGRLGLRRNLSAGEIVGQLLAVRPELQNRPPLRNLVFMGMGEPMDNLEAVLRSIEIATQNPAPQLAPSHITVSTSGILPAMRRFLAQSSVHLALSLHATTDEQRTHLMPHNATWPIASVLELLRGASQNSDRIFFIEYVLFENFNDSPGDAHRLLNLLRGVHARVNLIAHNPFKFSKLRPSPIERILRISKHRPSWRHTLFGTSFERTNDWRCVWKSCFHKGPPRGHSSPRLV